MFPLNYNIYNYLQAMYLRVSGIDFRDILASNVQNPAVKRLQRIVRLLKTRNVLKVLSNADSDRVPVMSQFGIDMVGWIEINRLAKELNCTSLGPVGMFFNTLTTLFHSYFLLLYDPNHKD